MPQNFHVPDILRDQQIFLIFPTFHHILKIFQILLNLQVLFHILDIGQIYQTNLVRRTIIFRINFNNQFLCLIMKYEVIPLMSQETMKSLYYHCKSKTTNSPHTRHKLGWIQLITIENIGMGDDKSKKINVFAMLHLF